MTGCPVIKIANVKHGRIQPEGCSHVSPAIAQQANGWWTREGDVLIAMTGYVGEVACARQDDRYLINQRVGRFELLRPDILDMRYLFYVLQHPEVRSTVESLARGSAQPNLSAQDLGTLQIPVPPLRTQRKIAGDMWAIDERLDTLRATTAILGSIGQVMFKSWFGDFDPVREKAKGREPKGMDAGTAALFPNEFEESDLGQIPKGWRTGAFGEIAILCKAVVNPLSMPDVEFEHYSLPAYDAGQEPTVERGTNIRSQKTVVPSGTVLLSKLNPHIPRVWFPGHVSANAICSTEFMPWKPNCVSQEHLYFLLKQPSFISALRTLVTGTSNSHQRVNVHQVAALPVVIPTTEVMLAFTTIVAPILARTVQNRVQAQTLASLRDELLPRLVSGILRVPEAKGDLEEVLG